MSPQGVVGGVTGIVTKPVEGKCPPPPFVLWCNFTDSNIKLSSCQVMFFIDMKTKTD